MSNNNNQQQQVQNNPQVQNNNQQQCENNYLQWIKQNKGTLLILGIAILAIGTAVIPQLYQKNASPSECTAEIRGLSDVGTIGEDNLATVQYSDKMGLPCQSSLRNTVKCTLFASQTSDEKNQQCRVKDTRKESISEIMFTTEKQGLHHLNVTVAGMPIKGSPFSVFILKRFGAPLVPISTITGLTAPQGITFNLNNDMIVAEYRGHRISIFDQYGKKLRSFGKEGSDPGQFYYPCDVAVDSEGNILVADGKNHRIQKFTSDGKYITAVGKHGIKQMEFDFPVGIGVHPNTKMIYVTENKNNRIQILNPDLTFHSNLAGQFNEPKDVAFDSHGSVYVADNEHHQIQVFSAEGGYLRRFGKEGKGPGFLNYPSSISINKDDIIYVLELYNYRVSVFTRKGKFLKSFGAEGMGAGQFKEARGIAVDRNGSVYVSDRVNNRIQVF